MSNLGQGTGNAYEWEETLTQGTLGERQTSVALLPAACEFQPVFAPRVAV